MPKKAKLMIIINILKFKKQEEQAKPQLLYNMLMVNLIILKYPQ